MEIDKTKIIGSNIELIIEDTTVSEVGVDMVVISGYANKYLDEAGKLIVDRSEESVLPQGYNLEDYKKNPILLYAHDNQQPIGKIINIDVRVDGLYIEAEVHKVMNKKVYYGVKNGILKTFSIGFRIKDYIEVDGVYLWTATDLVEISIVSVPNNQDSLFTVLTDAPCQSGVCLLGSKAISTEAIHKQRAKLMNKTWSEVDKQAVKDNLKSLDDTDLVSDAYLVVKDVEDATTWKFPHHDLDGDRLIINKGGLISAFSALKGVQGNDILTVEEKLEAATHLKTHFKELLDEGLVQQEAVDAVDTFISSLSENQGETPMKVKDNTEPNTEEPSIDEPSIDEPNTTEQSEDEHTINTYIETEKDNETQNPSTGGEGDEPSDSPKELSFDDMMSFIGAAKTSQEGVEQLFVLYAEVTSTLNEVLETE